ncbi:MAG: EamA family transporter [Xanthomonadales bacterium]|nr:EamA family transporter [Xanthomonadales bacterium]
MLRGSPFEIVVGTHRRAGLRSGPVATWPSIIVHGTSGIHRRRPYHTQLRLPAARVPARSASRPALVALAVITLIWGYNWIVMKQALRFSGPFEFSALRYVLGSGVLFMVLLVRRVPLRPPPLGPTILIGLSQTLVFQALVQWALVGGGAGKTALLAYTMPFWVVLINWLAFSERPAPRVWLSLAIAAAGLLLVLAPWQGVGGLASSVAAIVGGIGWAVGVVATKRLFQRRRVNALSLTAWQMLVGSLGLVGVALAVPERAIEWSGWFCAALAYNAILSSGLAWLLWSWIVERLPAHIAGLSSLAVPVVGIGFAWLQLSERPSPTDAAGIVLILAALALATLRFRRG